ncbi:MAG: RNA polymerase sigma factor [Anaerolineales bacterium]
MDEQRAIQLLKQGDIAGLEYLVATYQVIAARTAYLIVQDTELAQDIVQDAFLRVYQKINTFDEQRSFKTWFLKIVVNDAIKALKISRRKIYLDDPEEDDSAIWERFQENLESLEDQVERNELKQQIWQALQTLSPRARAVIVARYYLGMSELEMAQQSNSSPGTIKWWLHHARERLRILLGGKL